MSNHHDFSDIPELQPAAPARFATKLEPTLLARLNAEPTQRDWGDIAVFVGAVLCALWLATVFPDDTPPEGGLRAASAPVTCER